MATLISEFCCFDNTKKWFVVNTTSSQKLITVFCGDVNSGFSSERLIVPANSSNLVCFSSHATIPPGVTATIVTGMGTCIPDTGREIVVIGDQVWMKKNLDVVTFRNGDPIDYVPDRYDWSQCTFPAWTYADGGSGEADANTNGQFGILYNWYAVNDPRGLAPEGWRIPTTKDFMTLIRRVGGRSMSGYVSPLQYRAQYSGVGRALKSRDYINHWLPVTLTWSTTSVNFGRNTNNSGFTAVGAGFRWPVGYYTYQMTSIPGINGSNYSLFKLYNLIWGIDDYSPDSNTQPLACYMSLRDSIGREHVVNPNPPYTYYDDEVQLHWGIPEVWPGCGGNNLPDGYPGSGECSGWGWGMSVRCILDCNNDFELLDTTTTTTIPQPIPPICTQTQSSILGINPNGVPVDVYYLDANGVRQMIRVPLSGGVYLCYCAIIGVFQADLAGQGLFIDGTSSLSITSTQNCSTTTTTTVPLPCCRNIIGLPAPGRENYINNVLVSASYTGPTLPQGSLYFGPNCTGADMPRNSVTLGNTPGSFSYVLTFSEPVNDIGILAYGGGTSAFGLIRERFEFNTDQGIPTLNLCITGTCNSNIDGNIYITGTSRMGASILQVHSAVPFTELTISGEGGLRGTTFGICPFRAYVTTTTTVPGTTTTTICPKTAFSLTNTRPQTVGTVTYFADNSFINVLSASVPYGQTVTVCATRIIYTSPNVIAVDTEELCCDTTTTTTVAPTTTTTTTCVIRTFTLQNTASNPQDVTYSVCGPIRALTLNGNETVQICASSIISSPPTIVVTNEGTGCNTTTTTTTIAPTTTTTTTCVIRTYTASTTVDVPQSLTYTVCGELHTVQVSANNPVIPSTITFCASGIVSSTGWITVTQIAGSCITTTTTTAAPTTTSTSTTTTTTIAPVGLCGRVDGLNEYMFMSAYVINPGTVYTNFTASYAEACQAYNTIMSLPSGSATGAGSAVYINSLTVGQTAWANPINSMLPCVLQYDGFYILTQTGSGNPLSVTNNIIQIVNGIVVSISTCGPCVGPFPTEKTCNYQLNINGVPQADFSPTYGGACTAVSTVNTWSGNPVNLQYVNEIGKAASWEVNRRVYKTTSTLNPPCPDPWTRNGFFVTNWATGEVTEIRNSVIVSIQNCPGFTTTTTTTCASLPGNGFTLINEITYNGGTSYGDLTASVTTACTARRNYINSANLGLPLIALRGVVYLIDSITVGKSVYSYDATSCAVTSGITGYYLLNDTLTSNRVVHVVNGIITEILSCNGQIECGSSFPEYTGSLKKDAYMNGQFLYNYSNQNSPALACSTCTRITANEPGLTVESIPGTIIYWDGDIEVGTILYKLSSAWQSFCPERYISLNGYFTHLFNVNTQASDDGNTVYHIVSGEIVEIIDCATNCQRPNGLNTYSFSHSIGADGGDPLDAIEFTGTKMEACVALADYNAGGFGFYAVNVQAESVSVGATVYYGNFSLECTLAENGWYIYNNSVIIHVQNGTIVEIVDNTISDVPNQPGVFDVIQLSSCPGRTYSYTVSSYPTGATSIYWIVIGGGTILSGQGTTSITVEWADGPITGSVRAYGDRVGSSNSQLRSQSISLPSC